ncbi:hypothetical protein Q75_08420 [Bacillus coahuilensis p1.1.43]|uniref:DUF1798 family protein n=1 Tax=Bacillus coahuilensis p1.1.43 TaxID=1150625 RepID=A0A147K8Z4_9BACI|nr:YppE family protein [Bacillus coahuilensis]KUP06628.1 hypothetical protein Q75_08420 [Bacillus coahuilensis p1.1.43]
MKLEELLTLTERLDQLIDECAVIYQRHREENKKGDFYTEVKPFADLTYKVSTEWKEEISNWLSSVSVKNLHRIQLEQACENIEMISVQAFFPETSYKRFQSYVQSTKYTISVVYHSLQSHLD